MELIMPLRFEKHNLQYCCLFGCDAVYRAKGVISQLDDGNNRILQNVCAFLPYYTVSQSEDCSLHSHRSENSNLLGLPSPLLRRGSVFVFPGTELVLLFH